MRAAVVGATGYVGRELTRLLAHHKSISLSHLQAQSLQKGSLPFGPLLKRQLEGVKAGPVDAEQLEGMDVVFLCLPHGASQELVGRIWGRVGLIVDVGADFRLDSKTFEETYATEHKYPELIKHFAPGIPELFGEKIKAARAVAVPGCYVTAAALLLAPLYRASLARPPALISAASGVSGAGAAARAENHFCEVDEDFKAYSVPFHRHRPEIENLIKSPVAFIPHLLPLDRGILVTAFVSLQGGSDALAAREALKRAYEGCTFVNLQDSPPRIKDVAFSNACSIAVFESGVEGWLVGFAALDNLLKGAAGQALQCANLALGLSEEEGLI